MRRRRDENSIAPNTALQVDQLGRRDAENMSTAFFPIVRVTASKYLTTQCNAVNGRTCTVSRCKIRCFGLHTAAADIYRHQVLPDVLGEQSL